MINKKSVDTAVEALAEIEDAFKDDADLKGGIQASDFGKPFALVVKNGEVLYKTFNPLKNGIFLGSKKAQLEWDFDPIKADFNLKLTQKFKNDDVKLIFSVDGKTVKGVESKPGSLDMKAKIALKIKF